MMPLEDDIPFHLDTQFLAELEREKEILATYVENSRCTDFGEYRFYTGQLLGLKLAERHFKQLVSLWENR
jgi:hypothetical protein